MRAAALLLLLLVAALFALCVPAHAADGEWDLKLLDNTVYPKALCLDGSPGGYYISYGTGAAASTWVLHLQGGGWCYSNENCAERAAGVNPFGDPVSLGGTGKWAKSGCAPGVKAPVCVSDGGNHGLLSSDPRVNPEFATATKVYIGYCDGGSFAGTLEDIYPVNATYGVHFKGKWILDAVMQELLYSEKMSSAESVIVGGCSAGGLAVFLHLDDIAAKINAANPGIRVVGLPGAGFFENTNPYSGPDVAIELFQFVFYTMNATVDASCIKHQRVPWDDWVCIFAAATLPHIETPLFISNSLADAAQWSFIMNLGCNPTVPLACNSSQIAYLNSFHDQMLGDIVYGVNNTSNGYFLPECFIHVIEDVDGGWNGITIRGQTQRETFLNWYSNTTGAATRLSDGHWGSNPTCNRYHLAHKYRENTFYGPNADSPIMFVQSRKHSRG